MNILELIKNEKVEWKKLGDIAEIKNGYTPSKNNKSFWENGTIPWFTLKDIRENGDELYKASENVTDGAIKKELFKENTLILSTTATIGVSAIIRVPYICNQQLTSISPNDKVMVEFLYYYINNITHELYNLSNNSGGIRILTTNNLKNLKVPIPSLEIQEKIVKRLDFFTEYVTELQAELQDRIYQYNYYRDTLLSTEYLENLMLHKNYELKFLGLGEIASISTGQKNDVVEVKTEEFCYPYVNAGTTESGFTNHYNTEGNYITTPSRGQGGLGSIRYQSEKFWCGPLSYRIKSKNEEIASTKFIYYSLSKNLRKFIAKLSISGIPALNKVYLERYLVVIPSIELQNKIVEILDKFEIMVNDVKGLLPEEIKERQKQYEFYRDKLLTFNVDSDKASKQASNIS